MTHRLVDRVLAAANRRKFDKVYARGTDPYRYELLEFERRRFELVEEYLRRGASGRLLEVGCGEGFFTRRLAALAERVVAVDVSAIALDRARRLLERDGLGERVRFVRQDIAALDLGAARAFDAVVVSEVLYYLGERNDFLRLTGVSRGILSRALQGLAGLCAPGGRVVLAHSFPPGKRERSAGYRRAFEALGMRLLDEGEVEPTREPGTDRCLVSLLEAPK